MALTTAGLTNGGKTAHYEFQYDDSLALSATNPAGSEPARTNAVIAACESDFALMSGWFGGSVAVSGINVQVTPAGGGASWSGSSSSSTVVIKAEGSSYSTLPDFIRYLLVAEVTEIMMMTQGSGWFQGHDEGSKGEALSRFLSVQFLDVNGLTDAAIRADFAVADGWLNSPRQDFVNNAPDDNSPDAVTGCTTLFVYFLFRQRGYSIEQIVGAGAATLAGVYRNLSGDSEDPFPIFKKTLDDAFPPGLNAQVPGPNPDNPFPLPTATFALANFGTAQGWQVDEHPRFLADTTGDGRADMIGFGTAGVYRSLAQPDGSFGPVEFVVPDFGTDQGWRVDQHPRFLADTTGDGRADIVGFGAAGVYRSTAQPDGSFGPVVLIVQNFGTAQGWQVDQHPRFLADTTGDGRADIVGFGAAGVYRSLAQPDGSFGPVDLIVQNFSIAQGWQVDQHPRFLADTTGDGRADIVGFGAAGVYRSIAQPGGSFGPVDLVVQNFGTAQGWDVSKHPRFLADTTGDGRADIVGFGDAGVYIAVADATGGYGVATWTVPNFGYASLAGGWRVESHVRILGDTTGDGRADIVGFGDPGVFLVHGRTDGGFGAMVAPAAQQSRSEQPLQGSGVTVVRERQPA